MGRNSKARRDARKKQQRRTPVQLLDAGNFNDLTDAEELEFLGVDPSRPDVVRDWVLGRGTPESYVQWALGYLAQWDGREDDDDLNLTARDMLLEYVTHDANGEPLTEEKIDAMQVWTPVQCAEFARQVRS